MQLYGAAKINEAVAKVNDVSKRYSDALQDYESQAKIAVHLEQMFKDAHNASEKLKLVFNLVEGAHYNHIKTAETAADNAEQIMARHRIFRDNKLQTMIELKCELETATTVMAKEIEPNMHIVSYDVAHFQVLYDPLPTTEEAAADDGQSKKKPRLVATAVATA